MATEQINAVPWAARGPGWLVNQVNPSPFNPASRPWGEFSKKKERGMLHPTNEAERRALDHVKWAMDLHEEEFAALRRLQEAIIGDLSLSEAIRKAKERSGYESRRGNIAESNLWENIAGALEEYEDIQNKYEQPDCPV